MHTMNDIVTVIWVCHRVYWCCLLQSGSLYSEWAAACCCMRSCFIWHLAM